MEVPSDASRKKDVAWAWDVAKRVVKRRFRVLSLVRKSYAKLAKNKSALAQITDDLRTLLRLAKAWAERRYTNVPWTSIVYVVGALVYLINPLDAIPDALAGLGFVDDIAVVTAVVRAVHNDLERFRTWEQTGELPADTDEPETPLPASLPQET